MAFDFKFASLLSAAGLFSFVLVNPSQAQSPIRACANPAGQLRMIGATDSCKSQETLVTWNSGGEGPTGPAGPAGPQGASGSDAEGVTGGADRPREFIAGVLVGDTNAIDDRQHRHGL